jgi:hypothetical protein
VPAAAVIQKNLINYLILILVYIIFIFVKFINFKNLKIYFKFIKIRIRYPIMSIFRVIGDVFET